MYLKGAQFKALAAAAAACVINLLLKHVVLPPKAKQPFKPGETDILQYEGLRFVPEETEYVEITKSWKALFRHVFLPVWVDGAVEKMPLWGGKDELSQFTTAPVDILDARKRNLDYKKSGIALFQLDDDHYEPGNWGSEDQVVNFSKQYIPHLKKLYPKATRFEFSSARNRGWRFDTPMAVDDVHTDFYVSDIENLKKFQANEEDHYGHRRVYQGVFGELDSRKDEARVIATLWKPSSMKTPVCDYPITMMDASSFNQMDGRDYRFYIQLKPFFKKQLLKGSLVARPEHRWYYYSFMNTSEVLMFDQYEKGSHKTTFHAAFSNPNCPPGSEPRRSVEMRVSIFFPRDNEHGI